jgi:hypothetical protein
MGQKIGPLHVDADDAEAIELLKTLRDDAKARAEIEANPRQGMLKHLRIDFPNAPTSVTLPDPSRIDEYITELQSSTNKYAGLSHGIILLYVAHGNG